jgi:hypothetical protein
MSVTPRAYGNANAMALLMAAFTEGDRRNRALGYRGAVGSAGATVGQLLGSVNVPIGIVTIAAPCSCHIAQRVRRPASPATSETLTAPTEPASVYQRRCQERRAPSGDMSADGMRTARVVIRRDG